MQEESYKVDCHNAIYKGRNIRKDLWDQQWASQVSLVVKNLLANAGNIGDPGSIPGSGRSFGVGNGNPLRYSCLESPMDRKAWQTTVHRDAKDQTRLK